VEREEAAMLERTYGIRAIDIGLGYGLKTDSALSHV